MVSLKSKEKYATSVLESMYLSSYAIIILSIIFVMCLLTKTIKKLGSTFAACLNLNQTISLKMCHDLGNI